MGAAFPLASSARYEALGTGTGTGTQVTASGTPNTKGSYATLGTTSFTYDGFYLYILGPYAGSNVATNLVDIAINNGGSDIDIVQNFYCAPPTSSSLAQGYGVFIPVAIPVGATVKAREQASAASVTQSVHIVGVQGDAKQTRGFRRLVCLSDLTTSNVTNTLTLSGTTLTGFTQVAASTSERAAALYAILDTRNTSSLSTNSLSLWDIAVGSVGSEVVFVPKIGISLTASARMMAYGPFPADIPAGSRLSIRAQCAAADTNTLSMFLYGLVP